MSTKNSELNVVTKNSSVNIVGVMNKTFDFAFSEVPMDARAIENARSQGGEVLHVPVAIGAIAVIYNLDAVDLKLSGEVLADIFSGKIQMWNDPAIAKLNPGTTLPEREITPVYCVEAGGATAIFTEYLSKRSAEFAKKATGREQNWPAYALSRQQSQGVATQVKKTVGSIGYVELALAAEKAVPIAILINKAGKQVSPETASVKSAVESAIAVKQHPAPYSLHPLTFSFTDAAGDASYPIVGASYALLYASQPKEKHAAVIEFLKWAVSDGQQFAAELHYAPLPAELSEKAQKLLDTVTLK
jgi:phosphate transport system substrate-binding protein